MGTYPHHGRVQVAKTVTEELNVLFCPLPERTPSTQRHPLRHSGRTPRWP